MAEPDEHCPGTWVELEPDFGYCTLGEDCRNPVQEAHEERFAEWLDEPDQD